VTPRVAILVPCYNEEHSIGSVVEGFRAALPGAAVYVYDNNSTDATPERARERGAIVRHEGRQGKGHVVQRMFADVEADVYVMADGDGTYDSACAPGMVDRVLGERLDMVVGRRVTEQGAEHPYPRGHTFGNRVFNRILQVLFGSQFIDVFSGYRVMTRRFVKTLPVTSGGFEIETELTTHALDIGAACAEVDTPYRARHDDSQSNLRTFRDGLRILRKSILLFRELRPLRFYTILSVIFTVIALAFGIRVLIDYIETGRVPHFPTAILAASIEVVAFVSLATGLVLDAVGRARRDARRLAYLAIPHPASSDDRP
jgi:glycosyltransferase involved in cell wall biosynthesis